ncbi:MAG: hypothetical protein CMH84_04085 [Nocardioides sp.]|nr:hypothetical protein [Nocardioides sp.]
MIGAMPLVESLVPTEAVTSPVFLGVRLALDLAFGVFLIGGLIRRSAVRGSRPRYTWATIQRVACWPGLVFVVMTTLRSLALLQPLALVLVPAALAAWAYTYRQLRTDGDDDWFTRTASRVRRWATARRTAGSPALAGGRA